MRIHGAMTVIVGLMIAAPANSADNCTALVAKPSVKSRAADAVRVKYSEPAASITAAGISRVMVEGPWRLVWATPANAERGVYFFRRSAKGVYRLTATWGGVLAPDEQQDGIRWAGAIKGGGPSPRLAKCFADAVIAGE